MKYIIDISDEYVMESALYGRQLAIPFYVNANDKSFYLPTGLKLTPYTEPDREAIEDEVWNFARRIICPSDCCEDSISKYTEKFLGIPSHKTRAIFKDLSYQEAKAKYEAWKKQKDEIRVGDEVTSKYGDGVVIDVISDDGVHILGKDGHWNEYAEFEYRKTGRHFDEIEELLKKMRGEL